MRNIQEKKEKAPITSIGQPHPENIKFPATWLIAENMRKSDPRAISSREKNKRLYFLCKKQLEDIPWW